MKYWVHKNNNRVGAHPTRPSSDWLEISYETYCKEYALEHNGNLPNTGLHTDRVVCTCKPALILETWRVCGKCGNPVHIHPAGKA